LWREENVMTCTGVVRDGRVELEGDAVLPEGTRVRVIPEAAPEAAAETREPAQKMDLGEWLEMVRKHREGMPMTGDSVEILRELREERSNR
jgi:hypothetical protein